MPSQYVPFKGTQAALSSEPSTGEAGVLAYTTDTQELYADSGSGMGIPAAWKLIGGADNVGVTQILAGIGVTISPVGGTGSVTISASPTTSLPASALTGTTLASNVTSSSLTTLAGGAVGSAAYTSASSYDVAGAAAAAQSNAEGFATGVASTAQSNAESFATAAVATETSRAEAAEALKAPLASPTFAGTPTVPTATAGTNTTQVASTGFVTGAVTTEKTRALTAEALKAPIASPTFTGTATAPAFTDGYSIYTLAQINRVGGNVEMQYAGGSGSNVQMFGSTPTPIVFNTNGSISLAAAQTTVNGSTSGNAIFSQPEQGPSYKKVLVVSAVGLSGTASYTFPTPFLHVPGSLGSGGSGLSVSAISTTGCTVTSTGGGGVLFIEGF